MAKTYDEKLLHYATAKRATAQKIHLFEDGELVASWVGKLRGMVVCNSEDDYKRETKEEALDLARAFRQDCIDKAVAKGLIETTEQ